MHLTRFATPRGFARSIPAALLLAQLGCGGAAPDPAVQRDSAPAGGTVAERPAAPPVGTGEGEFGRLIERLSEAPGYFDTDNLISNEASYLHVVGTLRELGVSGGVYLGVGPDQNFSYMANIRPEIAFIVDIRRDNMLQHLMFKALFLLARNRLEYLCLLTGRPLPADLPTWRRRGIEELVAYVDGTAATRPAVEAAQAAVLERVTRLGVALSEEDLKRIRGIHERFIRVGLDLRFRSFGRPPLPEYPSYRQLLLERDLTGRRANYLARADDFEFVRSLQERDLVIPVTGDLAGEHALQAIGSYLEERGLRVSAFYTSNVEYYLMRDGVFGRFVGNIRELPKDGRSVIIRSYFGRRRRHPQAVPGYVTTQLLQRMESLIADQAAGGYRSYLDLVIRGKFE